VALTTIERVLQRVLVDCARKRHLITYAEVADRLSPHTSTRLEQPWSPMYAWLGNVFAFEVQAARPPLTALVVHADHSGPGNGFFECAAGCGELVGATPREQDVYWRQARDRVHAFWSTAHGPDEVEGWVSETYTISLTNGARVRVRAWPDGEVRITVDDGPYVIKAASLGRGTKGTSFLVLTPGPV
jgi:hypothetical protein